MPKNISLEKNRLKQTEKKDVELKKNRKIRRWNLVRKEHKEKKKKSIILVRIDQLFWLSEFDQRNDYAMVSTSNLRMTRKKIKMKILRPKGIGKMENHKQVQELKDNQKYKIIN